jgi:hypothetical protein
MHNHILTADDIDQVLFDLEAGGFEYRDADTNNPANEIEEILNTYKGPLSMDAARSVFLEPSISRGWITIQFPVEVADAYGIGGFAFHPGEVYRTLASKCREPWRSFWLAIAAHYPATPTRPTVFHFMQADDELSAAIEAMPDKPSRYLQDWLEHQRRYYRRDHHVAEIALGLPDEFGLPGGWSEFTPEVTTAWLMRQVLPEIDAIDPTEKATLSKIAENCFPDYSIWIDLNLPDGELKAISYPRWRGQEVRKLAEAGRRLPGSVQLVHFAEGSAYSRDDGEFEYSIHIAPHPQYPDEETVLLLSDRHVLTVDADLE